jgi:hypothetical protein
VIWLCVQEAEVHGIKQFEKCQIDDWVVMLVGDKVGKKE